MSEPQPEKPLEPAEPEPMTPSARRHRRIIFALMLLFCALPLVLLLWKLTGAPAP